jgi:adenine-specific DNA methylase
MNQHRRKLIEVALPLDAIGSALAREESIRRGHGHPSSLYHDGREPDFGATSVNYDFAGLLAWAEAPR